MATSIALLSHHPSRHCQIAPAHNSQLTQVGSSDGYYGRRLFPLMVATVVGCFP